MAGFRLKRTPMPENKYQENPQDINGISYTEDKTIGHREYWRAALQAAREEADGK